LKWMADVNEMPVDVRSMPRKFQQEAYLPGLIPHLPGESMADTADEDQTEDGSWAALSWTRTADAAVLDAELHLRQPDCTKAIAAFTQAIDNHPTADAYQGRAKAYRGLAEKDEQKAREHGARESRPYSP